MEKIELLIGSVSSNQSGHVQDARRPVEFAGEELGSWSNVMDENRPVRQTLYRAEDGRLIVYVEDRSNWRGESSTYSLHEAAEAMLGPGGRYEELGQECGFGRPLTLDEALTTYED